jgi:hypothetical protein
MPHMQATRDTDADRRPSAARGVAEPGDLREEPVKTHPTRSGVTVSISAETYGRLLSLADQAPLEGLALTERTLARAKTLGYNQIGQIRNTSPGRLLADLGEERADELLQALQDFGMRMPGA